MRRSGGSVLVFSCPSFRNRVTANKFKAVPRGQFYSVIKHFYLNGNGLSQNNNGSGLTEKDVNHMILLARDFSPGKRQ